MEERLWDAVTKSDEKLLVDLLQQGLNVNHKRSYTDDTDLLCQETVLHVALRDQIINKRVIQVLLDAGANVDAIYETNSEHNWSKESAFLIATHQSLRYKDIDILEMFLSRNPNVNYIATYKSFEERSWEYFYESVGAVNRATNFNNPTNLKLLLQHGADVDAEHSWSSEADSLMTITETALHTAAAREQHMEVLQILLQYGANPNALRKKTHIIQSMDPPATTKDIQTPVHIALLKGLTQNALLLIDYGADTTIPCIQQNKLIPCSELMDGVIIARLWQHQKYLSSFPISLKYMIKTVLLCAHRQHWNLPNEILRYIILYTLTDYECKQTTERKVKAKETNEVNSKDWYCTIT